MIRKLIVVAVLVVVAALSQSAHAAPRHPLPTNPCIESLMDTGFNYKTARLICSQPHR